MPKVSTEVKKEAQNAVEGELIRKNMFLISIALVAIYFIIMAILSCGNSRNTIKDKDADITSQASAN